jgi:ribosomal-protein-alanine N-acetyltransferase
MMLTTSRLTLAPLTRDDTASLHALWTTPGVRRYLWDGEVIPSERTTAILETNERLFDTQGFGLWGARPRDERSLVGFGGFWHFRDPPQLEILYGVAEPAWGLGFATEIARAVVDAGFGPLGFASIRGSTDADNGSSVRVMEKLGFTFERRAVVRGLDTVFFVLERSGTANRTGVPPGCGA